MATTVNSTGSSTNPLAALQGTAKDSSSTSSAAKGNTAEDMQTRFLNLLITQLQNQDPLNPMDNAQMTTQLSQISTVSGIEKLNSTMEKLLGSYAGSQNMQAAAMIGKQVLTPGSALELGANGALGGVDLPAAADKVTITIKDASGKIVDTQSLGAQPAGTLHFSWDGQDDQGNKLPAGKYSFSVAATGADGKKVETTALGAGTVNAITLGKDGLSLQLVDGKTVSYADVKQIMN